MPSDLGRALFQLPSLKNPQEWLNKHFRAARIKKTRKKLHKTLPRTDGAKPAHFRFLFNNPRHPPVWGVSARGRRGGRGAPLKWRVGLAVALDGTPPPCRGSLGPRGRTLRRPPPATGTNGGGGNSRWIRWQSDTFQGHANGTCDWHLKSLTQYRRWGGKLGNRRCANPVSVLLSTPQVLCNHQIGNKRNVSC